MGGTSEDYAFWVPQGADTDQDGFPSLDASLVPIGTLGALGGTVAMPAAPVVHGKPAEPMSAETMAAFDTSFGGASGGYTNFPSAAGEADPFTLDVGASGGGANPRVNPQAIKRAGDSDDEDDLTDALR